MLANRVTTDVRPYDKAPVPLSGVGASKRKEVPLSMSPFKAELETLVNIWLPAMPFPACAVTAGHNHPVDIVRCAVKLPLPATVGDDHIPFNHASFILVIGSPRDIDEGFRELRKDIVGRHEMQKSASLELITSFRYDAKTSIATFFLSRCSFDRMLNATPALEIGILDIVFWRLASLAAPFANVRIIGSLDAVDPGAKVAKGTGRISQPSWQGTTHDVMVGLEVARNRRVAEGRA